MSSLKPLGLNVLLNACNIEAVESSTQFADHVMNAASKQQLDTVPVVNRRCSHDVTRVLLLTSRLTATCLFRCFCNVASAIGFQDESLDIFDLQHTLGVYRNLVSSHSHAVTVLSLFSSARNYDVTVTCHRASTRVTTMQQPSPLPHVVHFLTLYFP